MGVRPGTLADLIANGFPQSSDNFYALLNYKEKSNAAPAVVVRAVDKRRAHLSNNSTALPPFATFEQLQARQVTSSCDSPLRSECWDTLPVAKNQTQPTVVSAKCGSLGSASAIFDNPSAFGFALLSDAANTFQNTVAPTFYQNCNDRDACFAPCWATFDLCQQFYVSDALFTCRSYEFDQMARGACELGAVGMGQGAQLDASTCLDILETVCAFETAFYPIAAQASEVSTTTFRCPVRSLILFFLLYRAAPSISQTKKLRVTVQLVQTYPNIRMERGRTHTVKRIR